MSQAICEAPCSGGANFTVAGLVWASEFFSDILRISTKHRIYYLPCNLHGDPWSLFPGGNATRCYLEET
jgi:hypothetical protein